MAYFMGIDTGTNSSKGILMDVRGEILAMQTTQHEMQNPKPGHYEHDAETDWWGDFCRISRGLLRETGVDPGQIKAVGISALGADCLPVDEECKPLRKAILYGIDARATEEMDELTRMYGQEQILAWYGRPLCSSDVMPKILWIKNNEPEVYAKTCKFLTGSSYITAKLTGSYVVDRFLGLASFNPLYAPETWKPVPELCAPVCRPDQLAEIREAADIAGYVTETAAGQTGLEPGTPVITGTDDSGAEAISCGVVEPGKMMLQLGSSVYMILGTDRLIDDSRLWREEFIVPGLCDISAGTNTAGSLTKWYLDTIFPDAMELERSGGGNAYQAMLSGVAEIPPGSDGLITLPYFAGERTPVNDPEARGVLFGLTLRHTRAHLYRSALEAVGYSVAQQVRIMESHPEARVERIIAVGGGAQNPIWLQIIADILGKPVSTPKETVGACYGDALMAALGVKWPGFETYASLTKYIRAGQTYVPEPTAHRRYAPYLAIYDELYTATAQLAHRLCRLCGEEE